MGPLLLIGNFLSCCITESMAASIDGVMVCTVLATLQIRRLLGPGMWAKVLAGCSLGQGEAAVVMTSMVAMVAGWPSVCSRVSGPRLALGRCQHGPLLSPVWSLPPSALRVKGERPARLQLQITLVQTFILFI